MQVTVAAGLRTLVDVAQLVELRIVIPAVAGSSPVVHPIFDARRLAQQALRGKS
jgi:hypothetical protein